jgi:DNA-binding beta-propeller fold protein YncE
MTVQLPKTVLALSVSLALWGCAAPQANMPRATRQAAPVAVAPTTPATPAPAPVEPAAQPALATQRQDIGPGLYEVAVDPTSGSLFVAATPSFTGDQGGVLYRLDPNTLAVQQTIPMGRRAFALAVNTKTNMVFVGNTLDGSLTAVDIGSGRVLGVSQLSTPNEKGQPGHIRKVLVDEAGNRIFVTGPAREGKVWIVNAQSGQISHTLDNVGQSTTGAAYDPVNKRLYVGNAGVNQIVVIDPESGQVVDRLDAGDTSKHFFINLAVDPQGMRLFATDSEAGDMAVFDLVTRRIVKRVPIGLGTLDVVYNPTRQEVYVTSRGVSREQPQGTGKLTVIDARSFEVKRSLDLPVHPNSMAVSPNGQVLYATVKAAGNRHPAFKEGAPDSVVRIDLN